MSAAAGFGPVFVVATLDDASWAFTDETCARATWAALVALRASCAAWRVDEHPSGAITSGPLFDLEGAPLVYVSNPVEPQALRLVSPLSMCNDKSAHPVPVWCDLNKGHGESESAGHVVHVGTADGERVSWV